MAKGGRAKNTVNKKKHSKLMAQKKNKIRKKQELRNNKMLELKEKLKLKTTKENEDLE